MLLENKNAVIYGGAGAVGSVVARAFAREGATVYLAGRTLTKLEAVAQEIRSAGGKAEIGQVDAHDKDSVEQHFSDIVQHAGHIDISFNLIDLGDGQGALLVDMTQEHFALPIVNAMNTHFLTATAASRHMAQQRSGVVLALTANVAKAPSPFSGGFGVACAAIESLFRQFSAEVSPHGVRFVVLRSAGSPDTPGVRDAMKAHADAQGVSLEEFLKNGAQSTLLKRFPMLADVANVAVMMASDYSSPITAAVTNVTCGQLVD
jgi:NAD(P)-dependent dehydrogenase (short-subunit alcohol dehydrogenase family)